MNSEATQQQQNKDFSEQLLKAKDHCNSIKNKYPQLFEYLMNHNKSEIKCIIMFITNFNNPEYEVVDLNPKCKVDNFKSILATFAIDVLTLRMKSSDEKYLIKFCDDMLMLSKISSKVMFNDEFPLSEDEDDDNYMNDNEINMLKSDELGYKLLCYNICPEVDITLDGITDEERKQHSILSVIEKKIKFKHVLKAIQKYIDEKLFNNTNEISVLGEVAKKYNLNFRIHVYNSEKHCEELLRKDNDGWIIKSKPGQTKFEIAKVGNHFFNYEFLNIPREYLNNVNKIYTYISLIGRCKHSDESELCEPCCSNLELITSLKKFKIVEFDKSVDKLVYKNAKISDKTGLNENTMILMLQTLHAYPEIQKYARKNVYKRFGYNQ